MDSSSLSWNKECCLAAQQLHKLIKRMTLERIGRYQVLGRHRQGFRGGGVVCRCASVGVGFRCHAGPQLTWGLIKNGAPSRPLEEEKSLPDSASEIFGFRSVKAKIGIHKCKRWKLMLSYRGCQTLTWWLDPVIVSGAAVAKPYCSMQQPPFTVPSLWRALCTSFPSPQPPEIRAHRALWAAKTAARYKAQQRSVMTKGGYNSEQCHNMPEIIKYTADRTSGAAAVIHWLDLQVP